MTSPLAAREMRGEEGGVEGGEVVIDCTVEVTLVNWTHMYTHVCMHVHIYAYTAHRDTGNSADASCVKSSATISINKISVNDNGSLLFFFFFLGLHLCYITTATQA